MSAMERHFEAQLAELQKRILGMAGLAEEQLRTCLRAFLERDPARAREVLESDRRIDAMENEIDEAGIHLLATQQPMARDLRLITMILKMSSDLERIGDHAVNIAESVLRLQAAPALEPPPEIQAMAEIATEMVKDAVDAFVERDARAGRRRGPLQRQRLPDPAHGHDGEPAEDLLGDGDLPREPEPRAHRRHGDEHRRGRHLHRRGAEREAPRR
jgi:phosphate uptake regulator